ncbi:uncharacterized protein LOC110472033 [Lonchura striata]
MVAPRAGLPGAARDALGQVRPRRRGQRCRGSSEGRGQVREATGFPRTPGFLTPDSQGIVRVPGCCSLGPRRWLQPGLASHSAGTQPPPTPAPTGLQAAPAAPRHSRQPHPTWEKAQDGRREVKALKQRGKSRFLRTNFFCKSFQRRHTSEMPTITH